MKIDNNIPSLFKTYGKQFFKRYPDIKHLWGASENHISLNIPVQSNDGFEINVQVEIDEIMISCGSFHEHYPVEKPDEDFINHFYGFIYDLLSPAMRVKEYKAGLTGYKWELQNNEEGTWITESTTGLLIYNLFARKSITHFSNSLLPLR